LTQAVLQLQLDKLNLKLKYVLSSDRRRMHVVCICDRQSHHQWFGVSYLLSYRTLREMESWAASQVDQARAAFTRSVADRLQVSYVPLSAQTIEKLGPAVLQPVFGAVNGMDPTSMVGSGISVPVPQAPNAVPAGPSGPAAGISGVGAAADGGAIKVSVMHACCCDRVHVVR